MTFKNYKTQILKDERSKKLNFEIDGRTHFVYRITQIKLNEHYYGSKTGKISILGNPYISKSKDKEFIKDQKENPQNYKYKVIRVFDNPADKMVFEAYLHQKFNVKEKNNFYNRANQTPFGFDTTGNKEIARKISKAKMGISPWNKGKTGLQEPWNKGLTKSSSNIVKLQSEQMKGELNPMFNKNGIDHPNSKSFILLNEKNEEVGIYHSRLEFSNYCRINSIPFYPLYNKLGNPYDGRFKKFSGWILYVLDTNLDIPLYFLSRKRSPSEH